MLHSYTVFNSIGDLRKEAAETAGALVELYEARHAAEPGEGYDATAAEWRAKLVTLEEESEPGSE